MTTEVMNTRNFVVGSFSGFSMVKKSAKNLQCEAVDIFCEHILFWVEPHLPMSLVRSS